MEEFNTGDVLVLKTEKNDDCQKFFVIDATGNEFLVDVMWFDDVNKTFKSQTVLKSLFVKYQN